MKSTLVILFVITLFSIKLYSQSDPCAPQCNVYFDDVFRMRCPTAEQVAKLNNLTISELSFNPDKVTLGGSLCGDKAAALLKKFRDEDEANEKFLRARYCTAQQGWVLKEGQTCVHGNPRPCCIAPEETYPWKRIDPSLAIKAYKAEQDKIFQQRLREIVDVVKPCRIQTINNSTEDLNRSYDAAIQILNAYREEFPSQATNIKNTHGAKINQLKNEYQAELNKGSNADVQKLIQYAQSMKDEENVLSQLNDKAEKEKKDKEAKQIAENKKKEDETKPKSIPEKESIDTAKSKTANNSTTYVDPKILEMKARYEEQHRKDSIEDKTMGTAIAATGATMLAMSDKELNRKEEDYEIGTYLKAVLGVGWNIIPLISNMNYSGTYVSQEATESFPLIEASFQFAAFNSSFITWKISPSGYFGMNAFDAGASGTHYSYGGTSSLGFGKKFKILLQAEYFKRSGSMTIDNAVNFSDSKGTVNYDYSTLKYGAGIQLRIGEATSGGSVTEYSLSAFKEELSFLKAQKQDVYSFQFKMSAKICSFFIQYSPDYPAAGDILFPSNYIKSKESLITISIAIPLTLFYK